MRSPGEELGGYRIVRWLGSGGMGAVYEAVDADGRRVALKLLHPHIGADPVARDRLRREVETLQRVRHRLVARVLDAEADSAEAFVVTELVEGLSLDEHVRRHGPLAPEEVLDLGRGLLEALTAIHAAGVVHRDVKPANVMLTAHGPVLIDFGISQIVEADRFTETGHVTGTPGFLDPALATGSATPGPAADLWSWAAVLLFASTGRPPFGQGSSPVVLGRAALGQSDVAGLPELHARALEAALRPTGPRLSPRDLLAVLAGEPAGAGALAALQERPGAPTAVLPSAPTAVLAAGPTSVLPGAPASPVPTPPAGHPASPPPAVPPAPPPPVVHPAPPPPLMHPVPRPPAPVRGIAPSSAPYRPPGAVAAPQQPVGSPWGAWSYPGGPPGAPGPGQPYPPFPVPAVNGPLAPARPVVMLVLWLAGTALAASWPGPTAVGVGALLLVSGAVGSGVRMLRVRRSRRGRRRSDLGWAWLLTPVHLVRAAVVLAVAVVAAGVLSVPAWWLAWTVATSGALGFTVEARVLEGAVTALAGAVALVAAWWAPWSGLTREGAREVLATLAPVGPAAFVLVVAGIVVTSVAAGLALTGVTPLVWDPFPSPFV